MDCNHFNGVVWRLVVVINSEQDSIHSGSFMVFPLGHSGVTKQRENYKMYEQVKDMTCTKNNKQGYLGKASTLEEAVQRWLIKAEEGRAGAQYNLAISYYKGEGIQKDWGKALHWFKAAGEQGIVDALYMLGMMYQFGKGVVPDAKEAFKWYYKAAELGDAESQYRVGNSYYLARGVDKDLVAAVKWWRKAAEQGHGKASHNLGTAYFRGEGVPMDKEEAIKWLKEK